MDIKSVSLPEVYLESQDFRFFRDWFSESLAKVQYDITNFMDLYDPLRCPEQLLWHLTDTIGFKYDDRLPASFNRLVLLYFMSMIRNRGSRDGMVLAAETNLAQFRINRSAQGYTTDSGEVVEGKEILYNRLEDTSIPVNSVYVTPHTSEGYIDVVYFSTQVPIDACIEYVRPVGMYVFQNAGVRFDGRTKISVDARLTNSNDVGMSFGPTHVGHYRREDYARLQKTRIQSDSIYNVEQLDTTHDRNPVWYRNSVAEVDTDQTINPGYRSLCSLQLCNNENVVLSLLDPIYSLGYGPQDVDVTYPSNYFEFVEKKPYNLRYDRDLDESVTTRYSDGEYAVSTIDADRSTDIIHPAPAVNPIMGTMGDKLVLSEQPDSTAIDGDKN